jgi:hypothetical protein
LALKAFSTHCQIAPSSPSNLACQVWEDLRWRPIEDRKGLLKKLIDNKHPGISFNKHFDVEGSVLFHYACKLGCEGIVSKWLGSPYRFGRSNDWIEVKNPAAPAVKRKRTGAPWANGCDDVALLPAAMDDRRQWRLFHREGQERAGAGVCLL